MRQPVHSCVGGLLPALAMLGVVAGCVEEPVEERVAQPAVQATTPSAQPVDTEDSIPQPRAVLNLSKPANPSGKAPPATVKPQAKVGKVANEEKPAAPPAEPVSKPVESPVVSKPQPVPALSSQILREFPWLQRCAVRVEAGGAIQCDADTLLVQPSARVQVFVRDPRLVRTEGGRIQLREGLPRLYRFFVFPWACAYPRHRS
ncbi:hypothetical protein [Uliginosibacterium gangwonense]|uniref:hypothetical protein n=1 Tax=Uliginosibacterium gangwonense TaxID=392736 RepID=UPI0003A92E69|nr:hypothetical protein [Uliginosibacterium gangwonense]